MDLLALAERAARQAAGLLRDAERPIDPSRWQSKGRNDFVTDLDRHAEDLIRDILLEATPEATLVGEEGSPELRGDGLRWIVDPLDGTTNYLHGFPACAVSIAAEVAGVLEAGIVLRLEPEIRFSATRGGGAFQDGRRLTVSTVTEPHHALIGTGFPFKYPELLPGYVEQFRRIMLATSGIRRAGSAALDLADVAAGRFDGFWELSLAPWDVAAGVLLVREAGGLVTDLAGVERGAEQGPVVAGNPAIHRWLLRMLEDG